MNLDNEILRGKEVRLALWNRLGEKLRLANLSAEAIAEETAIGSERITQLFRQYQLPRWGELVLLCRVLGTSLFELVVEHFEASFARPLEPREKYLVREAVSGIENPDGQEP